MGFFDLFKKKTKQKFDSNKIYTCKNCGYHQGISWDGKMRRCKSCGSFKWN